MADYYARDGQPLDLMSWAQMLEERGNDYRRVAEDTVGPYWISTVWLGLDHNFMRGGPPLIFETMVFHSGEDGPKADLDIDMDRYSTEEQALAGHEAFVTLIRATLNENFPVVEEERSNDV